MAYLTPQSTRDARHDFEKAAAEALAKLAYVLVIDFLRGWNHATKENVKLAETALQKAYGLHRSVPLAHVAESKIREIRGDLRGAIDALNEALALDPDLAVAYADKANAHILLGEPEKAPDLLTRAFHSRDPDHGLFDWFMGRAYFTMGDKYDEAIEYLKKSVKERPETWFSWAHLISAYALTKQASNPELKEAVDEYRSRFKEDWPLDPNIRHYYTQAKYRNAPRKLREALDQLFKGLEDARTNAHFP